MLLASWKILSKKLPFQHPGATVHPQHYLSRERECSVQGDPLLVTPEQTLTFASFRFPAPVRGVPLRTPAGHNLAQQLHVNIRAKTANCAHFTIGVEPRHLWPTSTIIPPNSFPSVKDGPDDIRRGQWPAEAGCSSGAIRSP